MNGADRITRWSTALAVLGIAAVAAVASYEHAYDLTLSVLAVRRRPGCADLHPMESWSGWRTSRARMNDLDLLSRDRAWYQFLTRALSGPRGL